jgi:hypothetical protein
MGIEFNDFRINIGILKTLTSKKKSWKLFVNCIMKNNFSLTDLV